MSQKMDNPKHIKRERAIESTPFVLVNVFPECI